MHKYSDEGTVVTSRDGQGATMAFHKCKLKVVEGPNQGHEFLMEKDVVRVGSSKDNDLVLEHETVSRHHFEVKVTEKGYVIEDQGSTNGTDVDGCRVMQAFLHPGARIGVGEVVLLFQPMRELVEVPLAPNNYFGKMLGRSLKMRALFHLADRVASRDTTVLITGDTGTGKGLLAEEIHNHSPRGKHPFITVDCSTIPANLMEAELFGHVKGAFTGAVSSRSGAFEEAHQGTIFFDEIGELPAPLQPKLLRVLEKRAVKRVGQTDTFQVDVRIVAATNRDLKAEVDSGNFREDLYFRLSVFELKIPPLRERKEDIPFLSNEFLRELSQADNQRLLGPDANRFLSSHDWPGNVRELRNIIERAVNLVDDKVIDAAALMSTSLGLPINESPSNPGHYTNRGTLSFQQAKEEAEQEYLNELLRQHDFNVSAAARTAKIHRQSLHRLLRKHGISSSGGFDDIR